MALSETTMSWWFCCYFTRDWTWHLDTGKCTSTKMKRWCLLRIKGSGRWESLKPAYQCMEQQEQPNAWLHTLWQGTSVYIRHQRLSVCIERGAMTGAAALACYPCRYGLLPLHIWSANFLFCQGWLWLDCRNASTRCSYYGSAYFQTFFLFLSSITTQWQNSMLLQLAYHRMWVESRWERNGG